MNLADESGRISYVNSKKAIVKGWQTIDGYRYYFDGEGFLKTGWFEVNGKKYVVNKNVVPDVGDSNVNVDWNNAFESISEKVYGDYTINHYINGSATITSKNGDIFFVRKSGDLILKKKELYEIIPNEKGNSIKNIKCSN